LNFLEILQAVLFGFGGRVGQGGLLRETTLVCPAWAKTRHLKGDDRKQ
jgi:hypothetical protein